MPVMVGAVLGWWQSGTLNLINLALALLGMAANAWGLAAMREYHDYLFSQRPGVRQAADGNVIDSRGRDPFYVF